jgi:HD-like signal output (HDOD) protein
MAGSSRVLIAAGQSLGDRSDKDVMTAGVVKPSARDQALCCLGKLPPFSPVLTRLIATLADEDVSFGTIADLIEKDIVLAGNILRLVNSALYGMIGRVSSVRHAVSLLGIAKLRNATLSLSVSRMWARLKTPPGWSSPRFNLHSVAVGLLADRLSQRLPVLHAEGAFIAGLFHDLGHFLIAVALPKEHTDILRLAKMGGATLSDYQREVLGITHAELSAEALAVWNLPESIQMAVRFHHRPEEDPTPAEKGELRLSSVIAAANACVHQLGMPVEFVEQHDGDPKVILERLDSRLDAASVLEEFENELSAIRRFF